MNAVLVTGVCGGVGTALTRRLVAEGWRVFGTDINPAVPELGLAGFWQGNVADEGFWSNVVVPGLSSEHGLKAFVHNAAVQPCSGIAETSVAEWQETIAVNLTAAFIGTRSLLPLLKGTRGSIVHVSSVHATATSAGMSAYVASKGGLLAFTRASALELADLGIRVNAVLPGAIDTAMLASGLERSAEGPERALEQLVGRTPLGRLASPDEIAEAILFLLNDSQSSYITGQSLVVDGGALAQLSTE